MAWSIIGIFQAEKRGILPCFEPLEHLSCSFFLFSAVPVNTVEDFSPEAFCAMINGVACQREHHSGAGYQITVRCSSKKRNWTPSLPHWLYFSLAWPI